MSQGPDTALSDRSSARGSVVRRPELVFGLVGALGTDLGTVQEELQAALRSVAYDSGVVRISELLSSTLSELDPVEPLMADLMHKGDELRRQAGADAAAALAITKLVAERIEQNPDRSERQAYATIIRSLKRSDEVERLRAVYGSRFILIGGWAPRDQRQAEVTRRLRAQHPNRAAGWYAQQTAELIERDEKDASRPLGQGVRDAFELADVYVAVRPGHPLGGFMTRLIKLLFGAPFETPTRDEQAMFMASGSGFRSSAAGRQVGAVVVDDDGEVLVTGTNEVPRAHGGQYWAEEQPDFRDFTYGQDVNDVIRLQVVSDMLSRLKAAGWLSEEAGLDDEDGMARRAMGGPLSRSRVGDLLEFGRIAHAEMACICTAARRGTAIRDCSMYTTTYPCHECARLIISAGIKKVIYVDPYPKSQVQEMFADEVTEGPGGNPENVVFEPFEGVAPRLFRAVFSMPERRRDRVTGRYKSWNGLTASPRLLAETGTPAIGPMEDSTIGGLQDRLKSAPWGGFAKDDASPGTSA